MDSDGRLGLGGEGGFVWWKTGNGIVVGQERGICCGTGHWGIVGDVWESDVAMLS